MKELELLSDEGFREKVRLVTRSLDRLDVQFRTTALKAMRESWTRDQWITFHTALAMDQADLLDLEPYARATYISDAIEVATLEYDVALD